MAKTETIDFRSFMRNDWRERTAKPSPKAALTFAGTVAVLVVPKVAFGATNDTFTHLHSGIMHMFDAGVVLIIMFAGAAWSLGHRSKAIEILIGVCCGYLLARHAVDIRDFLRGI